MLIHQEKNNEARSVEHVCITPSVKTFSETDSFLTFAKTHEWVVDGAEEYGRNGILSRIHCKNCGLERMAIISEIAESEERAREYRRKCTEGKEEGTNS